MPPVTFALILLTFSLTTVAQVSARDHLIALARKASLVSEGKPPFHLAMSFQMYDLDGKPTETGLVEEWWVSADSYRIEISAPSDNELEPMAKGAPVAPRKRERFLIHRLLRLVTEPVEEDTLSHRDFKVEKHTFGKLNLLCYTRAKNGIENYCSEKDEDKLRLISDLQGNTAVRNAVGDFHGSDAGVDLQLSYNAKLAITGRVTALHQIDPDKTKVTLLAPSIEDPGQYHRASVKEEKAEVIGKLPPTNYGLSPPLSGSVVLSLLVDAAGNVADVDVVAGKLSGVGKAEADAMRKAHFKPALRNGVPVPYFSTIIISFSTM